ncbi:methylenetetrahydrofolate reductase [NAD(P)H] [Deltaproteobacteria bacterium TL4]
MLILCQKQLMRIIDLYRKQPLVFSIEIFPPKTPEGMSKLKERLQQFVPFRPDYISVTYGAGGSTQNNTHEMASYIKNEMNIEAMAHLTCVSHTRTEINAVVEALSKANITNIMALRGDPPQGMKTFRVSEGGFKYAKELIQTLAVRPQFGIAAAGYPEGHIESESLEKDREYLMGKIEAGAEFIITQFFLDNDLFLQWREQLRKKKVKVPLVPGILPALSAEQITRFASMNGCHVPSTLIETLQKHENDSDAMRDIGLEFAQKQIEGLRKEGVEGIHLYALNRLENVQRLAPIITG